MNKCLHFGDDPGRRLYTGIDFRIRNYWEIRKVVNGHTHTDHTDLSDGGTAKMCLGGGMHCLSASSSRLCRVNHDFSF